MIVANSGGNDVLVYLGLGDGQFAAPRSFYAGTEPVDVQVADVNGDGRPDVIVTNQGSNDVSILLGDPTLAVSARSAIECRSGAGEHAGRAFENARRAAKPC